MQAAGWFRPIRSVLGFAVLAGVSFGVVGVRAAQAQEATYREVKPMWDDKADAQKLRARESLVRDVLNGRQPMEGQNKTDFEEYFTKQVFPKMTLISNLGNLDDERRSFFKIHFQNATGAPQPVHDHLVKTTSDLMQKIAINPMFHPYVRYTAMLIVGDLNQQEWSGFGQNRRPPVPYAPALTFLLAQLQSNDPNQIDIVRIGALEGILRHAQINAIQRRLPNAAPNWDQATNSKVINAAMAIAEQKTPPQGRSPEGHTWMRRRAIDVLIAQGSATGSIALLENILADATEPLSLRCTAAEAVGKMPTSGGQANFDVDKTAQDVVAIAIETCQAELKWWDEEKKREDEKKLMRQSAGGGALDSESPYGSGAGPDMMMQMMSSSDSGNPYGMGMMSPDGKAPEKKKKADLRLEKTQRRLKTSLYYVKLALDGNPSFTAPKVKPGEEQAKPAQVGGMLARANAQQQTQVTNLSNAVKDLFLAVDKAEPERETMLAGLRTQLEKLQSLAGGPAGAGGPPAGPPGGGPPSGAAPPGGPPSAGPPSAGPPSAGPPSAGPPGGSATPAAAAPPAAPPAATPATAPAAAPAAPPPAAANAAPPAG